MTPIALKAQPDVTTCLLAGVDGGLFAELPVQGVIRMRPVYQTRG
jgi:hypothetical protein